MAKTYYDPTEMAALKIPVTIDGDLALSLLAVIGRSAEDQTLDELVFGRSAAKLEGFIEFLLEKIDAKSKEEV